MHIKIIIFRTMFLRLGKQSSLYFYCIQQRETSYTCKISSCRLDQKKRRISFHSQFAVLALLITGKDEKDDIKFVIVLRLSTFSNLPQSPLPPPTFLLSWHTPRYQLYSTKIMGITSTLGAFYTMQFFIKNKDIELFLVP